MKKELHLLVESISSVTFKGGGKTWNRNLWFCKIFLRPVFKKCGSGETYKI